MNLKRNVSLIKKQLDKTILFFSILLSFILLVLIFISLIKKVFPNNTLVIFMNISPSRFFYAVILCFILSTFLGMLIAVFQKIRLDKRAEIPATGQQRTSTQEENIYGYLFAACLVFSLAMAFDPQQFQVLLAIISFFMIFKAVFIK